jgi:Cof subfamily protein (haloacid dehalogenase superfamily)
MAYKVVAVDLDGTLLDSQWHIRPDSIDALAAVRARGIRVVIVTGRHHIAARPYHAQLGLDTPAICCNGTYVYDYGAGRALTSDPLGKDQARAVLALVRRHGVHCSLYAENAILFEDADVHHSGLLVWAKSLPAALQPRLERTDDFARAIETERVIWKFVVTHTESGVLRRCVEDMKRSIDLSYEWSWHDLVDVVRAGNSKGGRLIEWARAQGVDPAEVLAIGDNHNDISMLTLAGTGIAMGNSDDAVKAHADWVTSGHDEDGVARALRRFVL